MHDVGHDVMNDLARRCRQGWALPRRILLSFAPSAAAEWHCDRVMRTFGTNSVRHIVFFLSVGQGRALLNSTFFGKASGVLVGAFSDPRDGTLAFFWCCASDFQTKNV